MINKIKNLDLYLVTIVIISFALRFVNLGYSDYQGDEIKAFLIPDPGQSSFQFLLDQRKGPIQFFVTYFVNSLVNSYDNQFLMRLPFALAGFLSVVVFYFFLKDTIEKKHSFYAAFFMATNGFFVAFSRIVQYQSFVIFFSLAGLYFLNLSSKNKKYMISGIFLGFLFWSLSILSHYDGIFVGPVVLYLLHKWHKKYFFGINNKLIIIFICSLLPVAMLLAFYVPFLLNVSESTSEYWQGRLTGDVSTKLSSSNYLFTVYQPIYVIHIYRILSIVGFVTVCFSIFKKNLKQLFNKVMKLYEIMNKIVSQDSNRQFFIYVLIWFGIALFFWEKIVYIPGTHIYNYLIPLFIILGLGIVTIENSVVSFTKSKYFIKLVYLPVIAVFAFITLQSYVIFVDNYSEYPWEEEKFYIWTLNKPTPIFHLSMFGFPYYRDWEGIRTFVNQHPDVTAYSTNERSSISRFYVTLDKDTNSAGFFVYIKDPQSFTNKITNDKASYWVNKYPPNHTFSRNGEDLVAIYIMEPGELDEIIERGF